MYEHIRCNFLPSRYLLVWLAFLNLWVMVFLCVIQWPEHSNIVWLLRVTILFGVVWHTRCVVQRDYLFQHVDSVVACLYHQGKWQLVMANGQTVDVTLHGDSVVWYELIVLGFTYEHRRQTRFLVVFPDSADKDTQRKLRVTLRLQATQHKATAVVEKIKSLILALKVQS